jgi:hypothetical protein
MADKCTFCLDPSARELRLTAAFIGCLFHWAQGSRHHPLSSTIHGHVRSFFLHHILPRAKVLTSVEMQTFRGPLRVHRSSDTVQPVLPRTTRTRPTPLNSLLTMRLSDELLQLGARQDHRERRRLRRWTTPIRLGEPCTGWVPALARGRGDDGCRGQVFVG